MKCPHCGKPISNNATFCGYCSKNLATEHPSTRHHKRKSRGKTLAISIAAFSVLALAGGMLLFTTNGAHKTQGFTHEASQQLVHDKQEASSSNTTFKTAVPSAPEEPESPPIPVIDLNDPDQYHNANLFLTNFTEYYCFPNGFTSDNYNLKELIEWGFWHKALNDSTLLEYGTYTVPGTNSGFSADVSEYGPSFSTRLSTSEITQAIEDCMGLSIDITGYDSADPESGKTYVEYDGYVYESTIRGNAVSADYVTICTDTEAIDNNQAKLTFNVYRCSYSPGIHSDVSWFDYSVTDIESVLDGTDGGLEWQGEAIVDVIDRENNTLRLKSIETLAIIAEPSQSEVTHGAQSASYQDVYRPIIQEYRESEAGGLAGNYVNMDALEEIDYFEYPLSYAYVDFAGDGEPELIIAQKFNSKGNGSETSGAAWTYRAYDLYGISNGAAERIYGKTDGGTTFGILSAGIGSVKEGELAIEIFEHLGDITQGARTTRYLLDPHSTNLIFLESLEGDTEEGMLYFTNQYGESYAFESASEAARITQVDFMKNNYYEDIEWHLVSEL